MLVKDILKLTCEFLDNKDLALKLLNNESLSDDEQKIVDDMLVCLNLARDEVSTEILPVVKIDKLKTQNLKVLFDDFSSYPISIFAVKDSFGRSVRHRVLEDGLIAFANEIEVWYTTKPEKVELNDKFSSTLPERVYAYATAREYYIKKALYKDAEIWEERFKNSIELLDRKKSSITLPRRRWL